MVELRTLLRAVLLWSDNATGYSVGFVFGKWAWCVGKGKQKGGYFLFFELDFADAQGFVTDFKDRVERLIVEQ